MSRLVCTHDLLPVRTLISRTLVSIVIILLMASSSVIAFDNPDSDTASNDKSSVELFSEALKAESNGDLRKRSELLTEAAQRFRSPAARWQLGQIEVSNDFWTTIDDDILRTNSDSKLEAYRQFRETRQDTLEDHLELARWCVSNRLPDQWRAHLERVLDFAPDHEDARRQLGYRLEAGEWISPSQLEARREVALRRYESMQKYGRRVRQVAYRLESRKRRERDAAVEELMDLRDFGAIGAVEEILRSPKEKPSNLVIDWMEQIDDVESSLALVRYGLYHPSRRVRNRAIEALKDRPYHDFVPGLMSMLSTPIEMRVQPSVNVLGGLAGYRQAFAREGYEQKEFLAFDQGFRRDPGSNFNTGIGEQIALQQSAMVINSRVATMRQQNAAITETNKTIGNILSAVTDRRFDGDARKMWDWWDRYNETEYQAYKQERFRRESMAIPIRSEVPIRQPMRTGECFVAGTLVTTQMGSQPIEKIAVGDLVLSRDIETGRIEWKPVLQATQRDPSDTRKLVLGDEEFCCSNGHLFWVSGKGWNRASQLEEGDVLHGAERPTKVVSNLPGNKELTYNLEVADNANYFVGQQRILSHDVTRRRANRQRVPGELLLRNRAEK